MEEAKMTVDVPTVQVAAVVSGTTLTSPHASVRSTEPALFTRVAAFGKPLEQGVQMTIHMNAIGPCPPEVYEWKLVLCWERTGKVFFRREFSFKLEVTYVPLSGTYHREERTNHTELVLFQASGEEGSRELDVKFLVVEGLEKLQAVLSPFVGTAEPQS